MRGGADLGMFFSFFFGPIFFFSGWIDQLYKISGKYLVDFYFIFIALTYE